MVLALVFKNSQPWQADGERGFQTPEVFSDKLLEQRSVWT